MLLQLQNENRATIESLAAQHRAAEQSENSRLQTLEQMVQDSKQTETQLIQEKVELERTARAEVQRIELQRQSDLAKGEREKADELAANRDALRTEITQRLAQKGAQIAEARQYFVQESRAYVQQREALWHDAIAQRELSIREVEGQQQRALK